MPNKKIHVVLGIIEDNEGKILLSKRAEHLHQGGLWEFPGGKVELDESVFNALARELQEEININIKQAERILMIEHDYADRQVILDVWIISQFIGEPKSKQNQLTRWVLKETLTQYNFPQANRSIINKLLSRK